ncbi:hypothetical protein L2Y90_14080 [Burkholderia pyrrocinia]|uniref:hypothetical protein n=1 Tax=Burkholderia pyrrocinia TaxID=60550 RepID=UPI00215B09BA|nr:hypothetical protein [Burkholderia pyrrocinia]UVE64962.1 hypothetical protein L2Y90_14080 [Burkholderia pyrrocinia]
MVVVLHVPSLRLQHEIAAVRARAMHTERASPVFCRNRARASIQRSRIHLQMACSAHAHESHTSSDMIEYPTDLMAFTNIWEISG